MNKELPLFPLSLVPFPGETINLHIFEARYKQLILDCYGMQTRFGIPIYIEERVQPYGVEMELLEIVKRYPDGKMDIRAQGKRVFFVHNFKDTMGDKLYAGGDVEFLAANENPDLVLREHIKTLLKETFQLLGVPKKITNYHTYNIAHLIGLDLEDEYELLKMTDELDRQNYIVDHLDRLLPEIRRSKKILEIVKMNGDFRLLEPLGGTDGFNF